MELVPGKVRNFNNGVYTFRSNCQFPWVEDFEDNNSSLITEHSSSGDTQKIVSMAYDLDHRFAGMTKALELTMKGADTAKYLDLVSFNSFSGLPNDGSDIILEFDIKSEIDIEVALDRISGAQHEYVPYLVVYKSPDKWKRFYVNLISEISGKPATNKYRIYFTVNKASGITTDSKIWLDNIRVTYLQ